MSHIMALISTLFEVQILLDILLKNLQTVYFIVHQFEGLNKLWDSPLKDSSQ